MARLTDHECFRPFKADIFGNGAADEGSGGTDQGLMDQLNQELAAAKAAEAAANTPPASAKPGPHVISAGTTHLMAANQAKATTKAIAGTPKLIVNPDGTVTNLNAPGAVNTPGGLNMKAPKKTLGQGIFSGFKPQNVFMTAGGAAIGFLLGGPIGAAAGAAVGGGADFYRAKEAKKTSTTTTTKKGQ